MGPKCCTVQCIVSGEENPQNCRFPWDFATLPEEDRCTPIGNMDMHRKIGKDRACGFGDILADRQSDVLNCLSQCFATAPAVEVVNTKKLEMWANVQRDGRPAESASQFG